MGGGSVLEFSHSYIYLLHHFPLLLVHDIFSMVYVRVTLEWLL